MSGQIYSIPNLACLKCKTPFLKQMSMFNTRDGQLHKGMVVICSTCGKANVLGDTNWHLMTEAEFQAQPEQTRRAMTVICEGLRAKFKTGMPWTPYDQVKR